MRCGIFQGVIFAIFLNGASLSRDERDISPQANWAHAAFTFINRLNCEDAFFTTERECRDLIRTQKSDVNVYLALSRREHGPIRGHPHPHRLVAVLPDGALSRAGGHDAVLVIDPYPQASYGHLIVVFFIDFGWGELQCRVNGGTFLDGGECMTLALKNRCYNLLEKKSGRRRNFARRCEINFLPLVHFQHEDASQMNQLLACESVSGFAECPKVRPKNETSHLICNPLEENTYRCQSTHTTVQTRCRVLETCDQAVLIGGTWSREHSTAQHQTAISRMYGTLTNNGFLSKVFYANGALSQAVIGEQIENVVFPAAFKLTMRNHIQKLCQSPHCVDSLVLYLNSPTRNDGSLLLWDTDRNGEASEAEIYTIRELLHDTKDCVAKQVTVLADGSYSGELVRAFGRSSKHVNVQVYASGREHEYSWRSEFSNHWASFRHTHTCTERVHEASLSAVRSSNPSSFDGSNGSIQSTIFGAPCNVTPPFTPEELQLNYLGCQNLPTRVWLTKFLLHQ